MEFKILGPLEVWNGLIRVPLGGPKQQQVLAVLLLAHGRLVQVERLVEAVWDGEAPATAAHQVRKLVADLRRRVGAEAIVTDGRGYRVDVGEGMLDLSLFELRMARAAEAVAAGLPTNAVAQLDLGLQLWRDTALTGLGGPVLEPAVLRLEERRLAACEQLFELRMAAGDAAVVLDDLRALVDRHPMRESLRRQLMMALHLVGRQSEALRFFADTRELLAEELGVEPGAALQRLHEQILRSDPTLDVDPTGPLAGPEPKEAERWSSPNTLPYCLPDFTGRAAELERVAEIGTSSAGNALTLVSIDGMAGVGKTSLALHLAHTLSAQFPDGQLFMDLRGHVKGIEPLHPAAALAQLLHTVGPADEHLPDDLAARSALWRVRTAGRRLVIVLDDAADVEQVVPLIPGSANCLLMVTSRARLTGLDGAVSLTLPPMSYDESVGLVHRITQSTTDADSTSVDELVELCGRLPLALRIAATRLRNRPMWMTSDLVDRLRAAGQRLEELTVGPRSVTAAIDVSYERLPAAHQRLLQCVAMTLGKDFDAHTAGAIADTPLPATERMLEELLDNQLLSQPRARRYAMHDLLRQYALSVLRTQRPGSEQQRLVGNLLDYYLHTAEVAASRIHPGRRRLELHVAPPVAGQPRLDCQESALAWFDQEQDGLLDAAYHAAANGPDLHGSHLPRALASYLQIRGRLHNHIDLLEQALVAAARTGDRTLEATNLSALSGVRWQVGDIDAAFTNMWRALDISEQDGDERSQGEYLYRIALLFDVVGCYHEAEQFLDRALRIHRDLGGPFEEGLVLNAISSTRLVLGRYDAARESAITALNLHRQLNHRAYEVSAMTSLATAQLRLGDTDAARHSLASASTTARAVGYRTGEALVLMRWAEAYVVVGDLDEAHDHGARALELIWTIQAPQVEAEATNILAGVHCARGELTIAMARYRNALEAAERAHYRIETARALEGIGVVHAHRGDVAEAARCWQAALAHHVEMGTRDDRRLRDRIAAVTDTPASERAC